jgi:GNAT superfamily N-acetyltransferase
MPQDLRQVARRGLILEPSPLLRHYPGGRHAVVEGVAFQTWGLASAGFNKVGVFGPSPPLARIRDLAAEFFGPVTPFGVLVEADAGTPVEAELRAAGWCVAEDEPALVLPALPAAPPAPPGLDIRKVRDAESRCDLVAVLAAAFGAMVYRASRTACVAGVGTGPAHRRRGFARALTWTALAEGAARGCDSAVLNALGASYALYRGMGFVHVCNHRTYTAPQVPAPKGDPS